MTTPEESLLARRFRALASADAGDRLDVRRRARRMRLRQTVLIVAATIVAVVVATPALGLHRAVIDWFEAEPAPAPVQLQFAQLPVGAPPGMDPGVIANEARRVTEVRRDGKTHVLWVAPTKHGGFCYSWTELWGGCRKDRTPPPMPPGLSPDLNPFLLGVTFGTDAAGVVEQFGGTLLATRTERLVAEFADGDEVEIPIVWVSAPIDAGFYLYWVAAERRRQGRDLTAVAAEDADGDVLARQAFVLTPRPRSAAPRACRNGEVTPRPVAARADASTPVGIGRGVTGVLASKSPAAGTRRTGAV